MVHDTTDPLSVTPRRPSSRLNFLPNTGPTLPLSGPFSSVQPQFFRPRSRPNHHPNVPGGAIPKKVTFQWVKGELLGKGSYAKVYYGLNATTGEIMAVKQVELPRTPSEMLKSRNREIAEALKLERETLMRLDHPNIVQYLGYEENRTYLSIFLEYVPGGTISSWLVTYGVFRTEVTQSFTRQILQGLDYLHGMGIIHRDLKSDNILVEQSGICKISDFGISKQVENIYQARAYTGMRGTIYWMAPEILDNDKQGYDLKVDIWSIGCVVLEMWTGERPWSGEEIFPVMIKLSQEKLAPPIPDRLVLSEAALAFRKQCFQRNPQDRPSAAELLDHQYLMLPPNWKFEPLDFSPNKRSISQSRRSEKSSNSPPTRPEAVSTIVGSTHKSVAPNTTFRARPQQGLGSRQKSGDGPQVVTITSSSSSSRPPQIIRSSNSGSSLETVGSVSTPKKGFHVVNPDDPDSQASRTPFVYNPPPLPSVNGGSPFSSRLQPVFQYGLPEAYPTTLPGRVQSTLSLAPSPQNLVSHNSQRPRTKASKPKPYNEHPAIDSEDDDIWAKPPTDLSNQAESTWHVSQLHGQSRAASVTGARDGQEWFRPAPSAVYENLQNFFPEYDLEKAVVPISSADIPSEEHGKDRKKSIRVVAKDRAQSGPQRGTRLWDNRIEELRM